MIQYTDEVASRMTESAARLLSDMMSGFNVRDEETPVFHTHRDVMAAFFRRYYTGKSEKFYKIHAAGILKQYNQFHKMMEAARGDLLYVCREYAPRLWKKGSADDCSYWLRLDAAVMLSSIAADGDTSKQDRWLVTMEQMLKLPRDSWCGTMFPMDRWSVKPDIDLSEKLEQWAIRSIQSSGLLFPGLNDLAGTLRALAPRHGEGRMLLDSGSPSAPIGLTACSISDISSTVSQSNMYSRVWAGTELLRTAEAVGLGMLPVRQGAERVRYVGQVLAVDAIMYWYSDGVDIVNTLSKLRAVPRGVSAAVEVISCVSRAAEAVNMDSGPARKPLWVDLEAAAKGVEMLAEHAQQNIIPQIKKESMLHLEELRAMGEEINVQMWRE